MPDILGKYWNGNYGVILYKDGTKVRIGPDDGLRPAFPESMDLKITNYCNMGCRMCHEDSTVNGRHGDILNLPFIDTMSPYTEIAIGGGNPLSHPDIIRFLNKLKERRLVANMTVNQHHFMGAKEFIRYLCDHDLVHGLGVSLAEKPDAYFIREMAQYPNAVLHVIAGVVKVEDLELLKNKGLKLLILGYKQFRRGAAYYSKEVEKSIADLYDKIPDVIRWFDVVSFDNLAIKQLDVKRLMSEDEWGQFYMGDDGTFTMYVDAVNREFAVSSVSENRYPLESSIWKMFETVKEAANEQRAAEKAV